MSESTEPYKVQGSRVYGQGYSYNLTSKIDAERLVTTLNKYETTSQINKNIEKQFDKLEKQVIQIKLSIGTLQEDIQYLKQIMEK